MNYSSANIQGWQSFSFTWATFLNCHEGFIVFKEKVAIFVALRIEGQNIYKNYA